MFVNDVRHAVRSLWKAPGFTGVAVLTRPRPDARGDGHPDRTTGAVAGGRVLSAVLYAVDPHDAVTFLGVAVALTIATATACAIPARRAAKTNPMQALRHD